MNTKIKVKLNDYNDIKKFIQIARSFNSDVDVCTDRARVDGKSIMGMYAVDFSGNTWTEIISDNIAEISRFNVEIERFKEQNV